MLTSVYVGRIHLQGVKMESSHSGSHSKTNSCQTSGESTGTYLCACCDRELRRSIKKRCLENKTELLKYVQQNKKSTSSIQETDYICDKCYLNYFTNIKSSQDINPISNQSEATLQLSFTRGITSHRKCTFGCDSNDLCNVPNEIKTSLLVLFKYFIPENSYMCRSIKTLPIGNH